MPSAGHDYAVPTPGVAIKLTKILHKRCSQGIEMDIANQLSEIDIFLSYNGFVAILKQMAVAFVTDIVGDGVSAQKPPHKHGQSLSATAQENMGMLCEAPSYVKLSFIISGMSFIFSLWLLFYYT
jgi:hypothetical protein